MKALVIGGGIFGVCAAIELSKSGIDTTIIERNKKLMQEATSVNQNRFHLGYHYPRSAATAKQCLEGVDSFKEYFAETIVELKENYYAIGGNGSKTSFEKYLNFCKRLGLPYKEIYPSENLLKRSEVAGCIYVNEKIIDLQRLKIIAEGLIKKYKVNVLLGREFKNYKKNEFDIVINATYSNINKVNKILKLPLRQFRYDTCNVPVIKLPKEMLGIGLTIMDGKFYSILPYGTTPYHLFWGVNDSAIRYVSTNLPKSSSSQIANYKNDCYIPLLREAKLIDVLRVTKILRSDVELSDERVTDLIDYGDGKFTILSAKLNTCVLTARKIVNIIKTNNN